MSEGKRLFFALEFEGKAGQRLWEAQQALKRCAVQGRFPPRANLHLTLAFLGQTQRGEEAVKVLGRLTGPGFWLYTAPSGTFPSSHGRLWWAGLALNPPLVALQGELCRLLAQQGFSLEDRPFRPHVTLGRQVILPPQCDGARLLNQCLPPDERLCRVSRVTLMESVREGGVLRYLPLARQEFYGGERD